MSFFIAFLSSCTLPKILHFCKKCKRKGRVRVKRPGQNEYYDFQMSRKYFNLSKNPKVPSGWRATTLLQGSTITLAPEKVLNWPSIFLPILLCLDGQSFAHIPSEPTKLLCTNTRYPVLLWTIGAKSAAEIFWKNIFDLFLFVRTSQLDFWSY